VPDSKSRAAHSPALSPPFRSVVEQTLPASLHSLPTWERADARWQCTSCSYRECSALPARSVDGFALRGIGKGEAAAMRLDTDFGAKVRAAPDARWGGGLNGVCACEPAARLACVCARITWLDLT
jgi:hypothetical protein